MADGKFGNLSRYVQFCLADVDKPIELNDGYIKAHGARVGNIAFVEIVLHFGEHTEIPDPTIYGNDRYAFKISHPNFQISPLALSLEMYGQWTCDFYLQGGYTEGRYFGLATIKEFTQYDQGWLVTMWLPQTEYGRNGRVERVTWEYPREGYQTWQGAILRVTGWYEVTPLPDPPSVTAK